MVLEISGELGTVERETALSELQIVELLLRLLEGAEYEVARDASKRGQQCLAQGT